MLAAMRRQRLWLLPLVVVLPLILFGSELSRLYYERVERPELRREFPEARSCSEFQSASPRLAPRSCDLARSEDRGAGVVVEHFYFSDSSRMTHRSQDGRWKGSSAECTTASRLSGLAMLGVAYFAASVLSHSLRTGQWF